jgi:hypothetical protein
MKRTSRPKFRPLLDTLEDRAAPGSLLDGLAAAALGRTFLDPLASIAALIGATPDRTGTGADASRLVRPGATLTISAGTPPSEDAGRLSDAGGTPRGSALRGPDPDPPAARTVVGLPGDDDFLFLPAGLLLAAPALSPAMGMKPAAPADAESRASLPPPAAQPASGSAGLVAGDESEIVVRGTAPPTDPGTVRVASAGADPASQLFGFTGQYETIVELPPNEAPVANDDAATVDEDASVVIDVLANDTDADGDTLLIDTWDWDLPNGTVTQTEDGKLKYTPFPDFHGTEKFTYAVTDGRDTATATVTVTVTPVNDAPVAFDDGFAFDKPSGPPLPPATVAYGYGAVLGNDTDHDGPSGLHIGYIDEDVDTSGTAGEIDMNPADGTFKWSGPRDWSGQTSFRYRVQDPAGAKSNWATVHLFRWPTDGPHDPAPEANDDTIAVGDGPQTFAVTENDANWSVAVLESHPGVGRLLAFDSYGGNATYDPRFSTAGASFSYTVFSARGEFTATATVQTVKPNLEIFNGQGGAAVREENDDEVNIGAFTVVNTNDTDGNGEYDSAQTDVRPVWPAPGFEEIDLMRLRVHRPNVDINVQGQIRIDLNTSNGKIWKKPYKQTLAVAPGGFMLLGPEVFTLVGEPDPLPYVDYWVEIFQKSNELRSVTITMTYGGKTDTVKATGVWADWTPGQFHINPSQTKYSDDADSQTYQAIFNAFRNMQGGFTLGQPGMLLQEARNKAGQLVAYVVWHVNAMEMEFTAMPAGIRNEQGGAIKFDLSRTIEGVKKLQIQGGPLNDVDSKTFPPFHEVANDDGGPDDEDNDPNLNNHIYSLDFPGHTIPISVASKNAGAYNVRLDGAQIVRTVTRMNAQEFVRVKLDGSRPAGNTFQGSRASEFIDWHSWADFYWDGKAWARVTNTPTATFNHIGLGHPWKLDTPAV